jgi:hypothetical protein
LVCLYFLAFRLLLSVLLTSNCRFIRCCKVRGEEGQRRRKMEKQEETERRQETEEQGRTAIKNG